MLVTGVDMVFDDQTEDLKLDDYGNLGYHAFADTPPNAVVRRLGTPPGGYTRMIRVGSEAKIYNQDYASALPSLLSSTNLQGTNMQAVVELAASQDGRITPVDFVVNQDGGSTHSFTLSYLTNENEVQSITASV